MSEEKKEEQVGDLNLIPQSVYDNLPAVVRGEVSKLSALKQEEFLEEYTRRAKKTSTAYLLFVLIGCHYGYLRRWGIQVLYWLTFGGFLVWTFISIFAIPSLVREYNKNIAVDVLRDLKIISN